MKSFWAPEFLQKRLFGASSRLERLREELEITQEQLKFLEEEEDQARLRALVGETPLAAKELREASGQVITMRNSRDKLLTEVSELKESIDQLLDEMNESRENNSDDSESSEAVDAKDAEGAGKAKANARS